MPPTSIGSEESFSPESKTQLPFAPVTKAHILHCSFHYWYPLYRSITPKARVILLCPSFLDYLRSDGIVLPNEAHDHQDSSSEVDSGTFSYHTSPTRSEVSDEETDPSLNWLALHQKIKDTIAELDGSVMPKLNWSAPKDAVWISTTNSMECRSPNDVYLLLKSSDFVTHDLEHAFDDCEDTSDSESSNSTSHDDSQLTKEVATHSRLESQDIPYHLVLRKTVPSFSTPMEFRCFVRARRLLCICQRDLNYYSFLAALKPSLLSCIQEFFNVHLSEKFPDDNFVFDVYIPPPHARVWLIDINPWAPRTDPLLFSWLEILETEVNEDDATYLNKGYNEKCAKINQDDQEADSPISPEFRLVNQTDPEAYNFNTPQYSAHKLPKDIVDASSSGEAGIKDFMGQWREILAAQTKNETDIDD